MLNKVVLEIMSACAFKQAVVCCLPGHNEISGNELADRNVIEAAPYGGIHVPQLPYLHLKLFI